ncbi:MAG: VIT1/CCC1 transporter family protein [Bacteroidales bacterium]|jgi:predicted membrane protein (TIGR00267 family)
MEELHNKNTTLVKDIIIGMSDGLTVPFALTAGLSGVLDTNHLIIVSGLAEITAGCISMGLGGFLAGQSEVEHYDTELKREYDEVETVPLLELKEVEGIFTEMGVEKKLSKEVAIQVSKDKNHWVDLMMKLELMMEKPAKNRAAISAGTIALSYLVGGFIPLFPYIITHSSKTGFYVSCIVTILALIIFGFFKSKMTGRPLLKGTLKVAITGIIAAAAAFLLAKAVS